ncbi:lysozyme inhibitor LprI family protein [Roseobacter sp. HKCCA0434]|uniref:lysozyme inhibitor LprI family protein n=1 Tax=Roseobacter sp. HKCCA0434 TaxID=3079297 RepID=UPI002905F12B|nr:lysozyme inhibitor LprI family protein [Roseobacter sp. HKCCA0434]
MPLSNRPLRRGLLVTAIVCGGAAPAQDLTYPDGFVADCLTDAGTDRDAQRSCIGEASSRCMRDTPGGHSTVAMGGCTDRELSEWDQLLNSEYSRLVDAAERRDAGRNDGATPLEDALRAMQREWIAFRDARCAFEAVQWDGGTGQGPAALACLMDETAEQALDLKAVELVR